MEREKRRGKRGEGKKEGREKRRGKEEREKRRGEKREKREEGEYDMQTDIVFNCFLLYAAHLAMFSFPTPPLPPSPTHTHHLPVRLDSFDQANNVRVF